ncbi:MAG: efflux RND transporter periplasmic adaptor subunit [Lutibacter sp.]|uniref:efflux RND transporter periplasmic adaptor subunit n=1 Tax=Lutibacter sp. TaxID=1925666 RepID=UPI00299E2B2B|nr:efflux RND transporter periplasmic adaptor subunit [Lutibacter sp.]MDX1829482.1 efflux RND transporter periplasmic adaptor subunit [Lutibacter sp.]
MKKISLIILTAIIAFSCANKKEKSTLEQLISNKKNIESKIDSLSIELKSVEQKISKLDTTKKLQIVTSLPVKQELFKHYVEIQGVVKTDKNIEIRPEAGGNITKIFVKEGQQVAAGQVLVQLDDSTIKRNIDELNTQLSLAKTTFERQKRLWDQKIGSEIQFLQAKTQKESLENNIAILKSQAKKMKIIAPFNGVIDEIFPKTGELTSPQTPVVRLINLDKMYVEAEVSEKYISSIKKGTEAIIQFENNATQITSTVNQVANYIDPNNRSFKVKIYINNSDKKLKPNLIANLRLNDFTSKNALTIPSNIIQEDQEGNSFVFKIEENNNQFKAIKTIIKSGLSYNNRTNIESGLAANDLIINKGSRGVKNNQSITVVN